MTKASSGFAVKPGPLGSFTLGSVTSPRTAGDAFNVSATAFDTFGNMKNDYTGPAALSSTLAAAPLGATPTVPSTAAFVAGVATPGPSITAVKREDLANRHHLHRRLRDQVHQRVRGLAGCRVAGRFLARPAPRYEDGHADLQHLPAEHGHRHCAVRTDVAADQPVSRRQVLAATSSATPS